MEGDRKLSTPSDGLGTTSSAPRIRALHGRTSGPTRRSTKGQWTAEEDEILRKAVERFKGKNWKKIAECFKDRTDVQCLHRWQKVLNPELVKGPWSKEEDEIIIELVNKYGPKKWSTIAQHLPGRIGKQCRERWHNHLNPAINKEAWTQEEELALIRAHRIYGNRWAELSKFLPGRTDNAIKNHWNSSVKKKLDSYLASGLLDQFPFSGAANQNQLVPLTTLRIQNTVDGGGSKGCSEAEDVSECSQESAKIGYSLSSSNNMSNIVSNGADQFYLSEANIGPNEQNSSPSCSDRYMASLEDVTFSIPEIPSEEGYSPTFDEHFALDPGASNPSDGQLHVQDLPNVSGMGLGHETSGLAARGTGGNHEVVNIYQMSVGFDASTSNVVISSDKSDQLFITDDECCRLLFLESVNDGNFPCENALLSSSTANSVRCKDSSICQSSDIQIAGSGKATGTPPSSSKCEVLGASGCQSFVPIPSVLSAEDNMLLYGQEPGQFSCQILEAEEEYNTSKPNGSTGTNNCGNSMSDDTDKRGLKEQSYLRNDSLKLVQVNSFNSGSDVMQACATMDDMQNMHPQRDPAPLFYEPPRFPSLDIPFFSCDLVQSGSDMQQEYSPLGIRQLMMSSMNSITPFKLWDSPTQEDGPDSVLKSAAKTFTNTPSILKKRHRDLLSPLSERRIDKKLETDMANSLTEDFSRLDVMFDGNAIEKGFKLSPSTANKEKNCKASSEVKENLSHVSDGQKDSERDQIESSSDNVKNKDLDGAADSRGSTKQDNVDTDAMAEVDKASRQKAAGVLVEHNMNNLRLLSPEIRLKADRSFTSRAWTPKTQHSKSLGRISGQIVGSECSSLPCIVVRSPAVKTKNGETLSIIVSSGQDASTAAPLANSVNNGGNENYNILGETPFKRSIESPSAWKSPWFINSFVPGPRIDTEITIEDFGFLMSPADRSYDAIGLMKQLSEHTAAAYADALEVLGNETPETLVKQRHASKINSEKENNQLETCSHMGSNVLTERRTLDFSECGTPGKGGENGKSSTATGVNLPSPSSYLLKSCR